MTRESERISFLVNHFVPYTECKILCKKNRNKKIKGKGEKGMGKGERKGRSKKIK